MKSWSRSLLALAILLVPIVILTHGCARLPRHAAKLPLLKATLLTTNVWYFAATCTDNAGLTSDYSTEVSLRDTNGTIRTVTLAWDRSQGTNVITNYTIWQGVASRTYTNSVNVGTNLTGTVRVQPPLPPAPTNLVITVTGLAANSLQGPWLAVPSWPAIVVTNPPANKFYRVGISTAMQ